MLYLVLYLGLYLGLEWLALEWVAVDRLALECLALERLGLGLVREMLAPLQKLVCELEFWLDFAWVLGWNSDWVG